jgi:hypothetical protein
VPAPELRLIGSATRDVVDWVSRQKILEVGQPQPVNVAGTTGLQLDVTPSGPLADICPDAVGHRLHLFQAGNDSVWVRDGQKMRIIALDVRGTTLTILAGGPEATFDVAMARFQPILDGLAFPE